MQTESHNFFSILYKMVENLLKVSSPLTKKKKKKKKEKYSSLTSYVIFKLDCRRIVGNLGCTSAVNVVYSRREEFAPLGSKFFPSRVDPFQGLLVQECKQKVTIFFSILYKMVENLLKVSSPLTKKKKKKKKGKV